eukprot:scaffold16043_cov115-Isochrysis_galbana.AAC.10
MCVTIVCRWCGLGLSGLGGVGMSGLRVIKYDIMCAVPSCRGTSRHTYGIASIMNDGERRLRRS